MTFLGAGTSVGHITHKWNPALEEVNQPTNIYVDMPDDAYSAYVFAAGLSDDVIVGITGLSVEEVREMKESNWPF